MNKFFAILLAGLIMLPAYGFAAGSDSDAPPPTPKVNLAPVIKLLQARQYGSAEKKLLRAVKSEPRNADAWNFLGYSQRKQKKYKTAELSYARALNLNPKHIGALEYLGELYAETGRKSKAKEMLKLLEAACGKNCSEVKDLKKAIW